MHYAHGAAMHFGYSATCVSVQKRMGFADQGELGGELVVVDGVAGPLRAHGSVTI